MFLSLFFGLVIGFSLGLTGGGGSIFAVPLLVYGLHTPAHQAVVISLAAVGATAFGGGLARLRDGDAEPRTAIIFGLSGIMGAPLGAWLNPRFPATILLAGFALLMLAVAFRMWRQASRYPEETRLIRANGHTDGDNAGPACRYDPGGRLQFTSRCALRLAVAGTLTGLLSGLFGVGGGFLIVPALVMLASLPMRRAVATSLWVIAIISAIGFLSHLAVGHHLNVGITLPFVFGGLGGMALGIAVGRYIAGPMLQKLFAGMVVVVAVFMLSNLLLFPH
ncbi:MAG: sulfite exporter TauE/SafE family protein [Candidatus Competibacteraceae bacterium]|nr:sulfite exporter TauE/SafE family protein [Candidatus Competibacteraceae bacterium]MCP5125525.1 sulfite exporter TauE/SafE family protein [Gammaproteobacteria bacterium]